MSKIKKSIKMQQIMSFIISFSVSFVALSSYNEQQKNNIENEANMFDKNNYLILTDHKIENIIEKNIGLDIKVKNDMIGFDNIEGYKEIYVGDYNKFKNDFAYYTNYEESRITMNKRNNEFNWGGETFHQKDNILIKSVYFNADDFYHIEKILIIEPNLELETFAKEYYDNESLNKDEIKKRVNKDDRLTLKTKRRNKEENLEQYMVEYNSNRGFKNYGDVMEKIGEEYTLRNNAISHEHLYNAFLSLLFSLIPFSLISYKRRIKKIKKNEFKLKRTKISKLSISKILDYQEQTKENRKYFYLQKKKQKEYKTNKEINKKSIEKENKEIIIENN